MNNRVTSHSPIKAKFSWLFQQKIKKKQLTSCLFSCILVSLCRESTLQGKNLLPMGANSFPFRVELFQKGGNIIFDKIAFSESVPIHLKCYNLCKQLVSTGHKIMQMFVDSSTISK